MARNTRSLVASADEMDMPRRKAGRPKKDDFADDKKIPTGATLPASVIARIDDWCNSQPVPAKRSAFIEKAVEHFLEKLES